MKILQAGNSNFGYIIAKELRKRGIETDLLISKQIISGQASINDPINYDNDLDSYPEWVIFGEINKRTKIFDIIKKMLINILKFMKIFLIKNNRTINSS